ncbi:unnamed protein product [Fraxinus pennsylvanica]|uniref:S-adenosyl-L-methionine-dependent methyltransferase n=1 Tax=Fraxinus pennsylvanica TaxID=56036 RepID=A0AAD2E5T5_9LAMI|nr:unnamed protein product [Fraxinus pennsylvanica]
MASSSGPGPGEYRALSGLFRVYPSHYDPTESPTRTARLQVVCKASLFAVISCVGILAMSRRPINPSRRISESGTAPFSSSLYSRSRSPPYLSLGLIILGAFLLLVYLYGGQGSYALNKGAVSRVEGDFSCTLDVQRAIPILRKAYGDSMHKVLHVGPDTCSVVSQLSKEEDTEAWGVEPYDIEDADGTCKSLVHKGIVRVVDIKFPLPYRPKSFSLVIASDALDYLSPKYLNKTLPELARVSADGLVIFTDLQNLVTSNFSPKEVHL